MVWWEIGCKGAHPRDPMGRVGSGVPLATGRSSFVVVSINYFLTLVPTPLPGEFINKSQILYGILSVQLCSPWPSGYLHRPVSVADYDPKKIGGGVLRTDYLSAGYFMAELYLHSHTELLNNQDSASAHPLISFVLCGRILEDTGVQKTGSGIQNIPPVGNVGVGGVLAMA